MIKALNVNYQEANDTLTPQKNAKVEAWPDVCSRFDGDVQRLKSIEHPDGYTALYLCHDEDNVPSYYMVEEDSQLNKMRHKVFLNKLGLNQTS